MTLLSLSSSINNKNEMIQRLTDELIAEQLLSSSLTDYDQIIIELQSKNDTLHRDLSITSETLVEKNFTISQLQEQLTTERRKLTRYKSSYNKNLKSRLANEQKKLNAQLEKDRLALQSQESELEQQRVELEKLKNTPPPEKTTSAAAQKAIDEERVEELMKKFNAYQVDLSVENQCDKDYLYRYNEAKSTLSHIRTYLQKNKMNSNYYHFVIANDTSITAQNRKLCLDD
ncbi:hypothetical protein L4C31_06505 [Aliivibrio sifiae]